MSYRVEIAQIDLDGTLARRPTIEMARSQSEAIAILRRMTAVAQALPYPMQCGIYDPGNRLVMSLTTDASERPFVAAV